VISGDDNSDTGDRTSRPRSSSANQLRGAGGQAFAERPVLEAGRWPHPFDRPEAPNPDLFVNRNFGCAEPEDTLFGRPPIVWVVVKFRS